MNAPKSADESFLTEQNPPDRVWETPDEWAFVFVHSTMLTSGRKMNIIRLRKHGLFVTNNIHGECLFVTNGGSGRSPRISSLSNFIRLLTLSPWTGQRRSFRALSALDRLLWVPRNLSELDKITVGYSIPNSCPVYSRWILFVTNNIHGE